MWSRGRVEPDYRLRWWERLGLYGPAYRRVWRQGGAPVIWVHAVSLGEARAAAPLIQALRAQSPGSRLLLTHTTATGREAGAALLQADRGDVQTWLPYDTPGAVRRFLRLHRPAVGVLMETEVWPVLQHQTRRHGVPMALANARLSDKSLRQGQRFAALLQPAVQSLRLILAQTREDADRLQTMVGSMSPGQGPVLQVCGNVKFDMTPAPALVALGQQWQRASTRPVVMAASTREGEEPGLLQAWQAAMQAEASGASGRTESARLWVVPRHPQRFDEVAQLITACGLSLSRRSTWPQGQPDAQALAADVWLGDSMGEMPAYFAAAQVALLGGSFAPLGGQNLIEAAACGCPIVMGPSTFNFDEAARLSEAAGAARRVASWDEGVAQALVWMQASTPEARREVCLTFAAAHQGAAQAMAHQILRLLPLTPAGLATGRGA